jgi:LuxR family maltose regulon positive regulatory protein
MLNIRRKEDLMKTPIIEDKLRPAINGHALLRERLIEDLNKNISKRFFLMVSYAGAGKTTLGAQFIQAQFLDSIWYNLDSYDQDPAIFFHYLITALQDHYPDFCQGIEPHSLSSSDVWPHFIQGLQKEINQHFFIVLDNYECIRGAKLVNQFLIYLLQHLPPALHLVILTNQEPRFSLTRYRLADDLHQLRAKDLAFNLDEAQLLIESIYHMPMPEATVKQIVQDTEGWALALVLFAQNMSLQRASRQDWSSRFTERYKEELHEYFLEEILRSHSPSVQDLLMSSALLPFISPNELRGFLGQENARVLLKSIAGSNMPVYPLNGGTGAYRYHNLFREFLLKKNRDHRSEHDIRRLHLKAAGALERNHPAEAINHYLDAAHTEVAVMILEEQGWHILTQGRYETLKLLLNKISPEIRSQKPVLLYYTGRLLEIHGDLEEAQQYYHKALEGLGDDAQKAKAACKERLGILELKKDRFKSASRIFLHTLKELEEEDVRRDIVQRLIGAHANLAMVYSKLEEDRKTSDHLKQAEKLFALYGKPEDENVLLQSRAFEYVTTGQFQEAVHLGNEGKDLCRRFGLEGHIPIYNHYLSFAQRYMGDFEAARGMAEEGLSMLKKEGVKDNIYGTLQSDLGHCEMAEGQTQEGIRRLSESSRIFKKNQNLCGQFWNDCAICLLSARQGNISLAWDYWRMMERNSRQLSLPMQHAMTLIVDAYLSSFEHASDKTMEKLSETKPFLERSRQKMSVFLGLVLAMKSYLTIGRNDLAEEAYLSATSLGEFEKCYYSYHYELDWFLPFAKRTVKKNPHLKPVWNGGPPTWQNNKPLGRRNLTQGPSAASLPAEGDLLDLHIHAFGPFRIVANGWDVPLDQCPSKKALTLMKYLFFKRHKGGIFLDEILELLWPDMDPKATRANLRVILSMLRKVFKRPDNEKNGFQNLKREDNKLSLALGKSGWTDVDEFLGQIKLAGYKEKRGLWAEALIHYEKIVELYQGDFLSEELYADWCYMEREYLKDQFLTSLMKMAECHVRLRNFSEAISTLYHALKVDIYREDAYQKLMMLCDKAGRKGEMIRAYNLCRKAIEEDLKLELSSDTRDLFKRISPSLEENSELDHVRLSLVR